MALQTRTQSQLTITMPTPATNPPSSYYVEYEDVATGSRQSLTRSVGTTTTTITLSNLDDISGAGAKQRGRLIEVTLRAEDANGAIVAGPACFRTC